MCWNFLSFMSNYLFIYWWKAQFECMWLIWFCWLGIFSWSSRFIRCTLTYHLLNYISLKICIQNETIDLCYHHFFHVWWSHTAVDLFYFISLEHSIVHLHTAVDLFYFTSQEHSIVHLHSKSEAITITRGINLSEYIVNNNVLCNNFICKSAKSTCNRLIASSCQLDLYDTYIPWNNYTIRGQVGAE